MTTTSSYDEAVDYLRTYASTDWLSLSIVLTHAHQEIGAGASVTEVVDMTLRMVADVMADGSPAGDLVADDRDFVAWAGGPTAQLDRIRSELSVFVAQDEIPPDFEICWFHKIDT